MQTNELLLTTYDNMLGSLDAWLAKAQEHGDDALLEHKLADDMFPLARQIRFCCNLPGEAMAGAAGVAFSSSDMDDTTLGAARERVAATRALIKGWRDTPFGGDEDPVQLSLANGMTFDLDTAAYVRDWALPQFYFHLMTAYAILRAAGVPLGKADYVGFMFRYLRQPPQS
ncbi:hypothetical protein GCM10011515_24140 [Tsuneonella deserti]|uniref:DUF1993 domain-containing protein n=1 Tax=Tsuneonella deserti TaxID=2035528 RepID=A0ABQ1SA14_9SPHN|nr:DUF1993 domain-containing protein [Tsuneonella deserti]GGE03702.1 hypothetical protein GCM10011515_24140 [Tsuneonella deserti]